MAHLIVFVLDCREECPDLLTAWEEAGAPGITILESLGVGRLRAAMREDLPLIPSLDDLLARAELRHRTIFTVVPDDGTLDRVIEATQRIVGDFSRPHSGLLFTIPVGRALGLKPRPRP